MKEKILFEEKSPFNLIQVVQEGDMKYMRVDNGSAIQSLEIDPEKPLETDHYWNLFVLLPFLYPKGKTVLLLGVGTGTVPKLLLHFFPGLSITGVERDPVVIKVGKRFFGLEQDNLNLIVKDGKEYMETATEKYDSIYVDVYEDDIVPEYFLQQKFYKQAKKMLNKDGIIAINVDTLDNDPKQAWEAMKKTFTHAWRVPTGEFNHIIIASDRELTFPDMPQNLPNQLVKLYAYGKNTLKKI